MGEHSWTADQIGPQHGRTVVVTGANSGLGLVAARELARAGAHVVMAVRDPARGEQAAATIDGDIEIRRLDLADLSSVEEFARGWSGDIDLLLNVAGIMAVPFGRTADGFELQLGTNHLGHFALTNRLLAHVTDRVVTMSSLMHRVGKIDLSDLNYEHRRYRRYPAYGQSKLANLLFTMELQRRLGDAGSPVRALAAHPGYAATNLQQRSGHKLVDAAMGVANKIFAQSAEHGALPLLWAATQDLPPGSYAGPDGPGEARGHPRLVGRTSAAADNTTAEGLWEASERLTGTTFPSSS